MTPLAWLKLGAFVAAVVAVLALGWRVAVWHESHTRLPEVKKQLKAEQECAEKSKCAERVAEAKAEGDRINQEAVDRYEREIEELRNRPIPHRVIRVCPPASNVRDATNPAGTGSGSAAEGVVSGADEFDTRPLRELAQLADEVSSRCRMLLERDRALARTGQHASD